MGFFNRLRGVHQVEAVELPPSSYFIVAGTEYRQRELKRLAKEQGWTLPERSGPKLGPIVCALVPEPTNPHDSKAVRVDVVGHHVGYVPRAETTRIRKAIAKETGEVGTAGALLYRGQNGQWKVRVEA